MKYFDRYLNYVAAAFMAAAIGITATSVMGQVAAGKENSKAEKAEKSEYKERSFCSNNNWSDDGRVSLNELRVVNVTSTGTVNVDAGKNGGISVRGDDRSDVQVSACIQAWGKSAEDAKSALASIKIGTSGEIKADGPSDGNWSVSYQIAVPRQTNLSLTAHNGGISINGTDGTAEFQTQNGGVNVSNVAGNVKGRTQNGGVNVSLSGTSWKGSGLDVETTNGGVNITLPENYAAHVETGTVNGGYKSDIPSLNVTTENIVGESYNRRRPTRVVTNLNGGGAPIRVITTNGGVKINTPDKD
ncbi:hypothetical protein BH10ACI2_BH10ACI2_16450 [soil metagenome]